MNFSKVASRLLARDRTRRWDFVPIRANAHPPEGRSLLLRTACAVPEAKEPGKLVHFFRLAEATRRQQWHKAGPRGASWAEPTANWLSPVDGLRPSRFVYWLSYGSSCLLPHGQVRESYTNKSTVAEVFLIVIHRKARFQLLFASPVSCLNLASKPHLARLPSTLSMGSPDPA